MIAGKSFTHPVDQRDAAGNRRLEPQLNATLRGELEEIGTISRQQHLVGGDHGRALLHRLLHDGERRLDAAHHFDEHVRR